MALDEGAWWLGEVGVESTRSQLEQIGELVGDGENHLVGRLAERDHLGDAVDAAQVVTGCCGQAPVLAVASGELADDKPDGEEESGRFDVRGPGDGQRGVWLGVEQIEADARTKRLRWLR